MGRTRNTHFEVREVRFVRTSRRARGFLCCLKEPSTHPTPPLGFQAYKGRWGWGIEDHLGFNAFVDFNEETLVLLLELSHSPLNIEPGFVHRPLPSWICWSSSEGSIILDGLSFSMRKRTHASDSSLHVDLIQALPTSSFHCVDPFTLYISLIIRL